MDWTSFPAYHAGQYGYIRASQLVNSPKAEKAKIDVRFTLRQMYGSLNYAKTRFANAAMRTLQPGYASPNPNIRATTQNGLYATAFTSLTIGLLNIAPYFIPQQSNRPQSNFAGITVLSGTSLVASVLGAMATETKNQEFDLLVSESSENHLFAKNNFLCDSIEFGNSRRIIGCAQVLRDATWDDLNLAIDLAANTIHGIEAIKPKSLRRVAFELDEIFHDMETLHPYKSIVGSMLERVEGKLFFRDGAQHFGREM